MHVHLDSTLEEYFALIDPGCHYWHSVEDLVLDDLDPDAMFGSLLPCKCRTICMQRRIYAPWWTLVEKEPPANLEFEVQDGDTWRKLYGQSR